MRVAVVAEINFFENHLTQNVVQVEDNDTWKDAYIKYLKSKTDFEEHYIKWVMEMPDSIDEARNQFLDGEMDICITFINNEESV